jgi:hypothetical protein
MILKEGDLVRFTTVGDQWDRILAKVILYNPGSLVIHVKLLENSKFVGPYLKGDDYPIVGAIEKHFSVTDMVLVPALEQLAMQVDN